MIKVFVATKEGQGKRKNDFCFANEGELLKFPSECDRETTDGRCGCKRSLAGLDTFKSTTTFKVIERDLSEDQFIELLGESDEKAGWSFAKPETREMGHYILQLAKNLPVGKILERRGNRIQVRE